MAATDGAVYLDTSLLVSLFCPEPGSERVERWVSRRTGALFISLWTLVEFASALGMKVRGRFLTTSQAEAAQEAFELTLLPIVKILSIDNACFFRAVSLLDRHSLGLRGPDALHLALCINPVPTTLATADRALHKSALALGQSSTLVI